MVDMEKSMVEMSDLDDSDFELLVLFADGELTVEPERRAQAEALVAQSAVARAIVQDLQATKVAIRDALLGEQAVAQVAADVSMVRGRVMTKLPAEPRRAPLQAAEAAGWMGWLRQFGLTKVGFALGAAVAVAAWMIVAYRAPTPELPNVPALATEAELGDQPVIIEEMEFDGESITVTPGDESGKPTVIWHFVAAKEGEG